MDRSKEIKELIRQIAGAGKQLYFVATVKSVEGETCTISYFDKVYDEVAIAAISDGEKKNLLVTPAVGSCVIVLDLSGGEKRNLAIIGVSLTDSITINGGELGGLIKIQELTDKLNKLKSEVNSLVSTFNSHVHTTTATIGPSMTNFGQISSPSSQASEVSTFNKSDYEDEKIKH